MSRFRLESDGDAVMTVPQPIFEVVIPPKLDAWDQVSLIKWKRARTQYEETVRERCQWSGENYDTVLRGIRTAVDPELLEILANYEIGKDKADITDKDIMTKVIERCETMNNEYLSNHTALFSQQLRMDLSIKDVPDRVAQYFRLLERIIMDNGFQDNLGRGSATDDNYVARMKQRTKFLVDNLSPTMLRDEIKGMLELVKYRHIRINDQLLYRLVLERAELQQLFYNRFKQQGPTTTAPKTNIRKGNRGAAAIDNSRRTELQHRSSSRGEQTMTARSPDATTRKNVAEIPHRRPPPKTDCFHCKGEHWLKDCPLATPEEKEEVRSTKSKNWKVKRAKLRSSTDEQDVGTNKEPPHNTLVEDDDYSVIVNGTVEVSMCPDTGTEECILPASVVEQLKSAGQELIMKTLENPVPVIGVGGKVTHSHETALVDLQIRTAVGPVNLYKIKCVVVEDEDQFLLSKVIMKRLGIDVKRAFEQFANTCIDLNLDDIPDEPDVDNSVQGEVEYEMNRMCNDVRTVLSDEHYASFRDEVIKLSKEFIYLYHTRIGPGEPARVEPLKVTLQKGVEPYRCKPRKYPPAQN